MRKNFWGLTVVVAAMVMMMAMPAYAGERKQDTAGWWYENSDGTYLANRWEWIDGKCYYFGTDGYILTNGMAPDGSAVNEKGEWTINGTIQAKNDGTGNNGSMANEQYPLKGRIESSFAQGSGGTTGWKWDVMYIPWNLNQDGTYAMNHTIQDRNPSHLPFYRGLNAAVPAELADYPATGLDYVDQNKKTKMAEEVRKFLNSFDWRDASDYEKVVHIANWIMQADYDYIESGDRYCPYGCLVNKMAVCDGYTDATRLLGTCIGIPVSPVGPSSHAYPVFLVDGVWLAHEPTSKDKLFTIVDVYETSYVFEGVGQLLVIGQYCQGVGYEVSIDVSSKSPDVRTGWSKGRAAQMIYFK